MEVRNFVFPLHPEDLLLATSDEKFNVKDELELDSYSDSIVNKILDGVANRIKKPNFIHIIKNENFDPIFGLLMKFTSLSDSAHERLFEVIQNNLNGLTKVAGDILSQNTESSRDQYHTYKTALKMSFFLLHWFLHIVYKSPNKPKVPAKGRGRGKKITKKDGKKGEKEIEKDEGPQIGSWDTETHKEAFLSTLVNILELDLSRLWKMTPEEDFISLFTKLASLMLEDSTNTKSKPIKRSIFIMVALLVKKYSQGLSITTTLIHLLHQSEHLSIAIAELLETMVKEHDSTQIVGDLLREIGKMNTRDDKDTSGVKNVSTFISELSEKIPKNVLPYVSVLSPHLDGESYTMRNGIIQMLGSLICKAFSDDRSDPATIQQTRDTLLDTLEERFRDINSHTRVKVVQTWQYLVENKSIPLQRLNNLTSMTIGRLKDKSSLVRKNAVVLLTKLLEFNPFGPELRLSIMKTKLDELLSTKAADKGNEGENEQPEDTDRKRKLEFLLKYYTDVTDFIQHYHAAIPTVCQLLGSGDILESIEFLVRAKEFGIENAGEGIRKMLMLIWSKEASIKNSVIEGFKRLYIDGKESMAPSHIAKNFIGLTEKSNLGELTSLEELMSELNKKNYINPEVVNVLWDIFAMKNKKSNSNNSRGALIILSMLANSDPDIIKSRINLLVQVGLGPRCKEDQYLARYTCIALQKLVKKVVEKGKSDQTPAVSRFKSSHPIFQRLVELVKDKSFASEKWYLMAEQAISTIYALSENPDVMCADVIKEMGSKLFPGISGDLSEEAVLQVPVSDLSKFFFLLGQIALKQLVYIEEIQNELRRRRTTEGKASEKKKKQKEQTRSAIEEELQVAQAAEETEAESLQELAEKEIVGRNLLGTFVPIIAMVCANAGGKFNDHTLRTSSVLALSKFMCVNGDFCEKHLQLLFTILETAPEAPLRSNIVIALGDLAFRFPNAIEPWTSKIYARLRDKDSHVRKNTMMVLTHLILNDMIKVKGQISEMAICLEDKDKRISDLAHLFFHELANKGNAIYNILPDLISSLSATKDVNEQSFRSIMKYLFSFIEREKQAESLVEKLCHRFLASKEWDQWRSIAYCLSLLNYNEKAIKKLNELHKSYIDKLHDEDINAAFQTIAKKFPKADMKEAIAELEKRVNHSSDNTEMVVNENVAQAAPSDKQFSKPAPKAKGTKGKRKPGAKGAKGKKPKEEFIGDSEESAGEYDISEDEVPLENLSDSEQEKPKKIPSKAASKKGASKKPTKKEESSSESEESENAKMEEDQEDDPEPIKKPSPPKPLLNESEEESSEEEVLKIKKVSAKKATKPPPKKKEQSESESESGSEKENKNPQIEESDQEDETSKPSKKASSDLESEDEFEDEKPQKRAPATRGKGRGRGGRGRGKKM